MIKIAGTKSNDKINFKEFVDFFYKVDWAQRRANLYLSVQLQQRFSDHRLRTSLLAPFGTPASHNIYSTLKFEWLLPTMARLVWPAAVTNYRGWDGLSSSESVQRTPTLPLTLRLKLTWPASRRQTYCPIFNESPTKNACPSGWRRRIDYNLRWRMQQRIHFWWRSACGRQLI